MRGGGQNIICIVDMNELNEKFKLEKIATNTIDIQLYDDEDYNITLAIYTERQKKGFLNLIKY